MSPSHQTVRLGHGKHRSPEEGVCAMELASMLADEGFSDRPRAVSPVIAAFLRTYNDGVDDEHRQDLYAYAARVVGSRAKRGVEHGRISMCLEEGRRGCGSVNGLFPLWGKASVSLSSAEAAGTFAARTMLRRPGDEKLHAEALAFLDRLIAAGRKGEGEESPAELAAPARLSKLLA